MTDSGDTALPGKQGGVFEDFIDVLVRPSALFDRVRNQGFVKPALVQTIMLLVLVLALRNLVQPFFDAEFARQGALQAAKMAESGRAMPEGASAMSEKIGTFMSTVGLVLSPWLIAIFGGLFTWIAARVVGARIAFGQAATIASWSYTPAILGYIVFAVQGALMDTTAVRGVSDAQIGPARFLDPTTASPVLLGLLQQLDLFNVWTLVLTAIGVAVVARTSISTGALAAIIRFAIAALFTLVPALLA